LAIIEPNDDEKDFIPPQTELIYPDPDEQLLTGFTPKIVTDILLHITLGMTLTDAANIVRLPPGRVIKWYGNNYCNFKYAVDFSKADNKRRHLKNIMTPKEAIALKASQFALERSYRDEYGKEIKIEVNNVLVDNITRVVFDTATRYIKDPETLKLFVQDLADQVAMINPSEGISDGRKLIS
jgi:hypothetical protein